MATDEWRESIISIRPVKQNSGMIMGMYVNQHKASRLKKKMIRKWGKNTQGGIHSNISLKIYNKHQKDFQNYNRVSCIWLSDSEALIHYK